MKNYWLNGLAIVMTVSMILSGISIRSFAMDDKTGEAPGFEAVENQSGYQASTVSGENPGTDEDKNHDNDPDAENGNEEEGNKMLELVEMTGAQKSPDEAEVRRKYEQITTYLISHDISVTTMESCTSGQIASLITDTEGASAIFKGAYVTYSNEAKVKAGVSAQVIDRYGVYSPQTAGCMAQACRTAFGADIGIGVTGSFGNADPANADSIPGEVFFAICISGDILSSASKPGSGDVSDPGCVSGSGSVFDETLCFHCSIPYQKSRYLYKLYMADVIADAISETLK